MSYLCHITRVHLFLTRTTMFNGNVLNRDARVEQLDAVEATNGYGVSRPWIGRIHSKRCKCVRSSKGGTINRRGMEAQRNMHRNRVSATGDAEMSGADPHPSQSRNNWQDGLMIHVLDHFSNSPYAQPDVLDVLQFGSDAKVHYRLWIFAITSAFKLTL